MKTILVIDDQERIRKTYKQAFERDGYRVLDAPSAAEGYQMLKEQKIDLLLLDIKMPEVDGALFHEVLRMFQKHIKIIISSVYPLDEQRYLVKGAVDYFDKSEGIKVLRKKVKGVLCNGEHNGSLIQKGGRS